MVLNKLFFSPTGGTKKIIDLFAEGWDCEKKEIDLTVVNAECDNYIFSAEDVCAVAVPVFEGRVPKTVVTRLRQMKGEGATAVLIAVYGARAVDDALLELRDILTEQGFRCRAAIAAVAEHSIMHVYGAGRPNQEDCVQLAGFSAQIRKAYQENTLPERVSVPGKFPYIEMGGIPIKPKGNESCIQCGHCAARCPVAAIPMDDFRATNPEKCIFCMRCIAECPVHARDLDPMLIKMTQEKMAPAFAGERHNELFLS